MRRIFFLLLLTTTALAQAPRKFEKATFAGGCFWCMQPPYDKTPGVVSTQVGYAGGKIKNPTYKQVSAGKTRHAEAIEIVYNPQKVTYRQLLKIFWMQIDPTQRNGQFVDVGPQYRTAIFFHSHKQRRLARESRKELKRSGRFDRPVVTEIVPATTFYPAEAYHQMYYKKNPVRYKLYRYRSGRDQFIKSTWGQKTKKAKKK